MASASDMVINIVGLLIGIYGLTTQNLVSVIASIAVILLNIVWHRKELEDDVRSLKEQIQTQIEIKRIWLELDKLKTAKQGNTYDFSVITLMILIVGLILLWLYQQGFLKIP